LRQPDLRRIATGFFGKSGSGLRFASSYCEREGNC
jgi:hypothetical protein